MIISCPECELQVSDKATSCPHCGYPLKPQSQNINRSRSTKRMRLPNGFGQISEIKNRNLRKPFRAMVTVGKTAEGRPICKPLQPEAYFRTYNEAYAALVEYNKDPYDIQSTLTMKDLYERWSEEYFKKVKSHKNLQSAWAYCTSIYDMRVSSIRSRHLKKCIEESYKIVNGEQKYPSAQLKSVMKTLFNLMFDYALEYELVQQNYARNFKLPSDTVKEAKTSNKAHIAFTDEEMEKLWEHVDDKYLVDVILIQCYSGWRPKELELLLVDDIDLENGYMRGGIKTEAGTNRIVPIHPRIMPLIERRYQQAKAIDNPYLFGFYKDGKNHKLMYATYKRYFCLICSELGLNPDHRPHDGRKHFITMAKKYNVDEYAIKYIVGHAIADITEKVYTEREISWLKSEIEKIK